MKVWMKKVVVAAIAVALVGPAFGAVIGTLPMKNGEVVRLTDEKFEGAVVFDNPARYEHVDAQGKVLAKGAWDLIGRDFLTAAALANNPKAEPANAKHWTKPFIMKTSEVNWTPEGKKVLAHAAKVPADPFGFKAAEKAAAKPAPMPGDKAPAKK